MKLKTNIVVNNDNKNSKFNILISLDSHYVMQAVIMLESLFRNNMVNFDVYLLHSSLKESEIDYILRECNNWNKKGEIKVRLLAFKIDNKIFKDAPIKNHVSLEAYYRLLVAEILPIEVKKILYLDVDIIINQSIEELYNNNFGSETLIFACEDKKINSDKDFCKRLNIPSNYKYINSGVLLINVELMRMLVKIDDIFYYIKQNSNNIIYEDQDIINAMFYDKIEYIDTDKYNFISCLSIYKSNYIEFEKSACIVHFAGSRFYKPWNINYIGKSQRLYMKYCEGTEYEKYMNRTRVLNVFCKPIQILSLFIKNNIKSICKI